MGAVDVRATLSFLYFVSAAGTMNVTSETATAPSWLTTSQLSHNNGTSGIIGASQQRPPPTPVVASPAGSNEYASGDEGTPSSSQANATSLQAQRPTSTPAINTSAPNSPSASNVNATTIASRTTTAPDNSSGGESPDGSSSGYLSTSAVAGIVAVAAVVATAIAVVACVWRGRRRRQPRPRVICTRRRSSFATRLSSTFLWSGGFGPGSDAAPGPGDRGDLEASCDVQYTERKHSLKKIRVPSRVPRKTSSSPSCAFNARTWAADAATAGLRSSVSLGGPATELQSLAVQQSILSMVNPCFEDPAAGFQPRGGGGWPGNGSDAGVLGLPTTPVFGSQVVSLTFSDVSPASANGPPLASPDSEPAEATRGASKEEDGVVERRQTGRVEVIVENVEDEM